MSLIVKIERITNSGNLDPIFGFADNSGDFTQLATIQAISMSWKSKETLDGNFVPMAEGSIVLHKRDVEGYGISVKDRIDIDGVKYNILSIAPYGGMLPVMYELKVVKNQNETGTVTYAENG